MLSTGPDSLYWLLLIAVATASDIAAGQFLAGRIPNLDAVLAFLTRGITGKLDRKERSAGALRTRGLITLLLCIPPLYFVGALADIVGKNSAAGTAIALLILLPLLSQKQIWLNHTKAGRRIATDASIADPHALAQSNAQAVILRYATGYVPTALLFALGGFAALLPYRFLSCLTQAGVTNNQPVSPYFKYIRWLHELITLPLSLFASLLLGLAHFFIPGTNLGVFWGLPRNNTGTIASYFLPLNIMANGSGLSFHRKDGPPSTLHREQKWIGPEHGRAKLTTDDMRSIWLVVLIAFGLSLIALAMWFVFLSVNSLNDL